VQQQLDGDDDAELLAAAAQRPEELGLGREVGPDQLAVRGHQLDRGEAVAREAVQPGEPAHAAVQRVGHHGRVAGLRGQRGEAVLGGGQRDVAPQRPGLDPRPPHRRVDLHPGHRRGADDERVARVLGRRVARAQHDDPAALLAGAADGVHGVLGAVELDDGGARTTGGGAHGSHRDGRALRRGCRGVAGARRSPQGLRKVREPP